MSLRQCSKPLRNLCLSTMLALMAVPAWAQAPSITVMSPLALKPGTSTDLTVSGGNLVDASELWLSTQSPAVLAPDVKDNGKNAARVVYRVTLPADAPVGIIGVRIATPNGISPMKLLAVDDLPSVAKAGNNVAPSSAQVLTLPTAVDGALGALQRDYYKFSAAAGQKISMEVLARRLGSALDPMIRLLDAQGRELAYSDDVPGLNADAQLCYEFKAPGEYLIEVRDIRFQGGGNHFYRLRVGDFPCVTVSHPMSIRRGTSALVSFAGSHIDGIQPVKVDVPPDFRGSWISVGARRAGGASSGFAVLSVEDAVQFSEIEPNDDPKQPNIVPPLACINGRFEKPSDIDHFVFPAKNGEHLQFTGVTRRQGAPTSLSMRLLNATGGQVAAVEDFGVSDAVFNFKIPADGEYTLAVQDLHRRGGPEFAYHIAVEPYAPGFELQVNADSMNVPISGTVMVEVNAVRKGYNGAINIAAVDLPEGVTSAPTIMGPGLNKVVLTLTGTDKLPAGKAIPVRVVGTAKIGESDVAVSASTGDALKAAYFAVAWPPVALTNELAIARSAKPQISLRTEPAQLVFGKDLSATVKVIATRDMGFDEAITLAVTPAQGGLPAGVTAAVKPIVKGQNEIEVVFTATAQAPLGDFTAVLTGTIKQGNVTVVQPTPGIGLKLDEPLKLTAAAGDGKLKKGGQLTVKVALQRNPAAPGEVDLVLQNLPKGVTAPATKVPADKNEVDLVLSAAADAQVGAVNNVSVKGDVTVGKAKLSGVSPNLTLTVE